ncbi:MAG: transglutaminaseTgpA domain-containing protein, partial [Terrimesophilobacter sp.]
ADLIAVSWRRPALTGLPLAAIVGIPTVVGYQIADTFIIIVTAVCWFILLRAGQPFPETARTFSIGALVVGLALVVPIVLPPVVGLGANGNGAGVGMVTVNPVLSLGSDLRRELPRTVLTYSTRSGDPTYLRLVSLQNFGADTWSPDPTIIDRANVPSTFRPPPGLGVDVPTRSETVWVNVENLDSPWLPTPYPPSSVSGLRGDWFWDSAGMTFVSTDDSSGGERYRVGSLILQPTPEQLTAALAVFPGDTGAEDQKNLELPEGMPPIIGETARAVTATVNSDYARAVALQEFFRNGQFTYSESTPVDQDYDGNGMLAIAAFLQQKSGYCIHFASSMAVMARTLGIPSRVTVGFLPGEKQTATVEGRASYRVTTQDVHAWPELYFEGIGWTRFEPTTSRGFVPSYADEATPGVPISPSASPTPTASPTPSATPEPSAAPPDPNAEAVANPARAADFPWLWAALGGLGIVLLLLLPAAVRAGQRAIRLRRCGRGHLMATTGWRELLQSAHDLMVDISTTATPREAAAVIQRAAQLGDADQATLEKVLGLVERQSFARGAPREAAGSGGMWQARVSTLLARLRSSATWRTRVAAAVAPRTVWSQLRMRRED